MALLDDMFKAPAQQPGGGGFGNDVMMALGLGLMGAGKTGKFDFKGLLNNMIAAKQNQALQAYRQQQMQFDTAKFLQEQNMQQKRLDLDTNKYNLDMQAAQREAAEQQRKIQGAEGITQSVGVEPNVVNNFQGQGMLGDIYAQKYKDFEATGEMPGISAEERRLRLMPDLLKMGDTNNALKMLPEPPKYGAPQRVLDAQGTPRLIAVDQNANPKVIENFQPILNKGLSVTMPDGTTIEQGGSQMPITTDPQGNMTGAPSKTVASNLQQGIVDNMDYLNRLKLIKEQYDSKFLTYGGELRGAAEDIWSKVTGDENLPFLKEQTLLKNSVGQLFNQYRKEITGASAVVKELNDLKETTIHGKLSPAKFRASLDQLEQLITTSNRIKQSLLAQGIPYGSKEYWKRMDEEYFSGNENGQQPNSIQTPQTSSSNNSSNNGVRIFNPETGKFE